MNSSITVSLKKEINTFSTSVKACVHIVGTNKLNTPFNATREKSIGRINNKKKENIKKNEKNFNSGLLKF